MEVSHDGKKIITEENLGLFYESLQKWASQNAS